MVKSQKVKRDIHIESRIMIFFNSHKTQIYIEKIKNKTLKY
jgi:hypothetical protein